MKYLIDTDWIIDYLKSVIPVEKKIRELYTQGLAVSIISLAELYEGVHSSKYPAKEKELLDRFFESDLKILGINENICNIFGQERSKLRKRGKLIDNFDLLIASTALNYKLTILTNNRKHFERIAGLKIISI